VRVTANPGTIGLNQSSTVTALVLNESGNGIAGERVFFTVSGLSGTTINPTSATTDDDGEATATLRSGTRAGTVTVTAEAGTQTDTVDVDVEAGPPQTMTLPNPGSVNEGSSVTLIATVTDAFGNPVRDGTRVNFSRTCPGGGNGDTCDRVNLSTTSTVTVNGSASTTVSVNNGSPETSVVVTAQAQGGQNPSRSVTIDVLQATPTPTPTPTATPTATPTP
jgi:hypothetical protein